MHVPSTLWQDVLAHPHTECLIRLALEEDIGAGDLTSSALFPKAQRVQGHVITRQAMVVCGIPLAKVILTRLDPHSDLSDIQAEGRALKAGDRLFHWQADACAVLAAERVLLNFLGRLCAVASLSRQAVEALPPHIQLYDTRKTTPGWRRLEKAAVRIGGACNHRMGLYDAILIKDNHVAAVGSLGIAVQRLRQSLGEAIPIEVEVDNLAQLSEALALQPHVIVLDNFTDDQIQDAIQIFKEFQDLHPCRPCPVFEVSGGVTLSRLTKLANLGVHRLSMGALTHHAVPTNLSLEIF